MGDIIDGWQLRRQWYWPQAHNDVVQKLLRKARKGTRVIFVPGNHDEFARHYLDHNFGGVDVAEDWIHVTADGRRLWVTHGDLFDGVIQCAKWLAYVGDSLYEFTLKLNRHLNSLRARLGLPYWSLSQLPQAQGQARGELRRRLRGRGGARGAQARRARRRLRPHPPRRDARRSTACSTANDGDWVESLTALVEHADGRLELLDWSRQRVTPAARALAADAPPAWVDAPVAREALAD